MGFHEVMECPARQFYVYLNGLTLQSRWMTAMADDYLQQKPAVKPKVQRMPDGGELIKDKAKARSLLFDQWS